MSRNRHRNISIDDDDFYEEDEYDYYDVDDDYRPQQTYNTSTYVPPNPEPQKPQPRTNNVRFVEHEVDLVFRAPGNRQQKKAPQPQVAEKAAPAPPKLTPIEIALKASPQFTLRKKIRSAKESLNLVVVGHVDSGKSTLMGHLLCQTGVVDQKVVHRYKQESARLGKASFHFAWVLDETSEERNRGVTMDIARACFETDNYRINILDAPGHKDFVPNMITGASEADFALLVINSTVGEFETGLDRGGQTREHTLLIRALGIQQVIVAVNKMDTSDFSKDRFEQICHQLELFLNKQMNFKTTFVPLSGLLGDNLTSRVSPKHPLASWYSGPCLLETLDSLPMPDRPEDLPLRIVVNDVVKSTPSLIVVTAKIEAGHIEAGNRVFIMPTADPALVKHVAIDDASTPTSSDSQICFAGEQVTLSLSGHFEAVKVSHGAVICRGGSTCLVSADKFIARIVVFDAAVPIVPGAQMELFGHSICIPCQVTKLQCSLNKSTGEVIKRRPRLLGKNSSGIVEIKTDSVVNLETYAASKALGRIALRDAGRTVACGIIESVVR